MKDTDIYQTLEDRQNYDDVEEHGPYFCYARYANGIPKSGVKEPRVESITDDNMESNFSIIGNIPPKDVSFSDFICIFAMPDEVLFDYFLQH